MTTYVFRNGELVDKDLAEPLEVGSRLQIIREIEPYKAVATDVATGRAPIIKSRADHREFIKRNGYIEVGSEKPKPRAPIEMSSPREILKAQLERLR
jgi:hypothetical protein